MTTKPKAKAPAKKNGSTNMNVAGSPGENVDTVMARNIIGPTVKGAVTTSAFCKVYGEAALQAMVDELGNQCKRVRDGDLTRAESLLTTQAHTLDAIFNELARRAAANMGEYINATDRYLRLALKAQSQCRATLETLATIKNPPVIFAKQANISNGRQQVNNGTLPPVAREEKTIQPNELLEAQYGQWMDTGTTGAAISDDKELETVGTINRAEDGRR